MGSKGFSNIFLLILGAAIISGAIIYYNSIKQEQQSVSHSDKQQEQAASPIKDEHDSLFKSFLNDSYQQYPKLQEQVSKDRIKNVFPLSLKSNAPQLQQGWIVEATGTESQGTPTNRYYLVTPTLEKELTDATSTVSDDRSGNCNLDLVKVITVDNIDYLVLSSKQCNGYGVNGSGSTSIYRLPDAEKIKLQASFTVPNMPSFWTGTSKSGNALGIFRDVYGTKQPMIAIDYGSENVALTAYFDLQTGKVNQLIRFD